MKDGIELRELRGIGKNDSGQLVAIDAPGRVGEVGAERLKNFAVCGLPGLHELVGDGISVEDREAKFAENCGDNAFATGYSAGEPEFQH
jgi:hypothetical protein